MSDYSEFTVGGVFGKGWEAFTSRMGVLIGTFVIWMLITFVGGIIPFVGSIFGIIIAPVLFGGIIILVTHVLDKQEAAVGDLFKGFESFGEWLGVYWLTMLIVMVPVVVAGIIAGIGIGIGAAFETDAIIAIAIGVAVLLAMAGGMVVMTIWGMSYLSLIHI